MTVAVGRIEPVVVVLVILWQPRRDDQVRRGIKRRGDARALGGDNVVRCRSRLQRGGVKVVS